MGKRTKRILIVGDEPILRDLLRDILVEERMDARVEATGMAGELLQGKLCLHTDRDPVDVLIVDGTMSGTDALTLIERAQAFHPEMHAILITAADRDEIEERGRHRSASFTLFTKPFSIDALLRHIDAEKLFRESTSGREMQ